MKGKLGRPFRADPAARWRRFATLDELKEIAALDVALEYFRQQVIRLRAQRFRVMNRANSRGYSRERRNHEDH